MTPEDRFKRAVVNFVRELFPTLSFLGIYEYRVENPTEGIIDGRPVDGSLGLPDLTMVQLRPSITGDKVTLAAGSVALIAFVNGQPSRPFVIAGDPATDPTLVRLNSGVLGCARQTDPVIAGPFAGTITMGSLKVKVG